MGLQAEVDAEFVPLQRITAVARRTPCPVFLDILWPPAPGLPALMEDPGVLFESPRRVVVFQRIAGQLRYYAGGWCPDQRRIYLEQDRIAGEGWELGAFGSASDALAFAEQFLVEGRRLAGVQVPREVRCSHHPDAEEAEQNRAPGRPRG